MDEAIPVERAGSESEAPLVVPIRPRVWTTFTAVFAGVVAATLVQALVGVLLLVWGVAQGGDVQTVARDLPASLASPQMFLLMVVCSQLGFAVVVISAAWLSPIPFRERLGLLPARQPWPIYPITMLGSLIPLAIGLMLAVALTLILPADMSVEKLFEQMTLAWAVPFVLLIALPPGIVEEMLFRGYMQRRLLERWRPVWAIGVTSLLFALVHVMPHTIVAVLPIGLWFGIVAWKCGSIFPAMLCHAFINGSLNAWRMIVKFANVSETVQIAVVVITLVIALRYFVLSLRWFALPAHASAGE